MTMQADRQRVVDALLEGAVDLHCHSGPSIMERKLDHIEQIRDAEAAGAQGVLVTDLPVGSDPPLEAKFRSSALDLIRLIAPTTRPERVREIVADAGGFIYYVSRTGVTGAREELTTSLREEVAAVRAASDLPVAVGFGISTPEQAAAVARLADGVVVGSAVVDRLARTGIEETAKFVAELRAAM